jgi:hypothetical protein
LTGTHLIDPLGNLSCPGGFDIVVFRFQSAEEEMSQLCAIVLRKLIDDIFSRPPCKGNEPTLRDHLSKA